MGGGGGLLSPVTNVLFGKPSTPSAPAVPDYTGAAQATAQGNLEAARAAAAANRVNQITPYGNLKYEQTGTDSYGNPTWTATQSFSPDQQAIYQQDVDASKGLGTSINAALGRVQQGMQEGFNPNLPAINYGGQTPDLKTDFGRAPTAQNVDAAGNLKTDLASSSGMAGWDRAQAILNQRLQPQLEIQNEQLDTKLRNQGIMPGTEAYNRAKAALGMQQNDLINQSQLTAQGIGQNLYNQDLGAAQFGNQALTQQQQNQIAATGFNNAAGQQNFANQMTADQAGNAALQQQFANQQAAANQSNTAQQQAYTQAMTNYNMPLNTLSALRSGAQVQNPNFVNVPQQATTQGADILGATQMGYNAQMGQYNAGQAAQAGQMGGLLGLGGSLGSAYMMSRK